MAEIAKSGTPSLASVLPPQNVRTGGLKAGEAIAAGDACYIKSDGLVWRASGAAANAAARVRGFALEAAPVGEPVTLIHDVTMHYGSGMAPGTDLYLSGTVDGGLADAASIGGTTPVAFVWADGKRIFVLPIR